jgi:hypothetical protein
VRNLLTHLLGNVLPRQLDLVLLANVSHAQEEVDIDVVCSDQRVSPSSQRLSIKTTRADFRCMQIPSHA